MASIIPYVIAACVAPLVAVLEFRSSTKTPFTSKAAGWWFLRLASEAGFGCAATGAVDALVADDNWAPPIIQGLLIGAATPAALRLQFFTLGEGQPNEQRIGVMTLYGLLRDYLNGHISDIEAEEESRWANSHAYPRLRELGWSSRLLADRLLDAARNRLTPTDFQEYASKLDRTLADSVTEERKLQAIIAHAREIRAHRTLRNLVEGGESPSP